MFGKRKFLAAVAIVALMLTGAVMAGTALQIRQPVGATVSIAGIGEGSGVTFNLIDNLFGEDNEKAGAAAGHVRSDDYYVVDFGANLGAGENGGSWGLSFGRAQTAKVGDNDEDFVFKLENNYTAQLDVDLVFDGHINFRGGLGEGVVVKFMNADDEAQWTLTGAATPKNFTITGDTLELAPGDVATFYLVVECTDADAGTWDPAVKFEANAVEGEF